MTRDKTFVAPAGVFTAGDVDKALALGESRATALGAPEIIVAGGGEIYAALIDRLDPASCDICASCAGRRRLFSGHRLVTLAGDFPSKIIPGAKAPMRTVDYIRVA